MKQQLTRLTVELGWYSRWISRDGLNYQITFVLGGNSINATIGEVFTSEKATALLLCWHIYRPAHITGSCLVNAIGDAINANQEINWLLPIDNWTDDHEEALTAAVLSAANTVNAQHSNVANWPDYLNRADRAYLLNDELGSLRSGRGAIAFDETGI